MEYEGIRKLISWSILPRTWNVLAGRCLAASVCDKTRAHLQPLRYTSWVPHEERTHDYEDPTRDEVHVSKSPYWIVERTNVYIGRPRSFRNALESEFQLRFIPLAVLSVAESLACV